MMKNSIILPRRLGVALLFLTATLAAGCGNTEVSKSPPVSVEATKAPSVQDQGGGWGKRGRDRSPLYDSSVPSDGTSSTARSLIEKLSGRAAATAITGNAKHPFRKLHVYAGAPDAAFRPLGLLLSPDIRLIIGPAETNWTPEGQFRVTERAQNFTDGREYGAAVERLGPVSAVVAERGTQQFGDDVNEVPSSIEYRIGDTVFRWYSFELSSAELKSLVLPVVEASNAGSSTATP